MRCGMIEKAYKGSSWYKKKYKVATGTVYLMDVRCSKESVYEDIKNSICKEIGPGKTFFLPNGGPLVVREEDADYELTLYHDENGKLVLVEKMYPIENKEESA